MTEEEKAKAEAEEKKKAAEAKKKAAAEEAEKKKKAAAAAKAPEPTASPIRRFKVKEAKTIALRGGQTVSLEKGKILHAHHYGLAQIEEMRRAGLELDEIDPIPPAPPAEE